MPKIQDFTDRQKQLLIDTVVMDYDHESPLYTSYYSQALLAKLTDNRTVREKWEALITYFLTPINFRRTLHTIISEAIKDADQTRVEVPLHIAHYRQSQIDFFTPETRKKLVKKISYIASTIFEEDRNMTSLELIDQIANQSPFEEYPDRIEQKWEAILHYCRDKNNRNHYLYQQISHIFAAHNIDNDYLIRAKECVQRENDPLRAKGYLDQIKNKSPKIHAAIAACHNQLAEKYALREKSSPTRDLHNANTIAADTNYIAAYTLYAHAAKRDSRYVNERNDALHNLLTRKLFSTYVKSRNRFENTTCFFFNFSSRKRLNPEQQNRMIENLEILSTHHEGVKLDLLQSIIREYAQNKTLGASKESSELMKTLSNNSLSLANRWLALEVYMLKRKDCKFVNNGRRLYRIIDKALEDQLGKTYSHERLSN